MGAYLTVTRELALHQATAVDEKRARGEKLPALAGIPCGKDHGGLPIGMQLIGKPFSEPTLYRAGFAFEQDGGSEA